MAAASCHEYPGRVCHQLSLCYSSGPTESCLVMKTRTCLFALFHAINHPLLAPTLSHEAAPVLSCRCCLEAAVPTSSSMFSTRETCPNSWCPSRTQHSFFCMLRKMVINLSLYPPPSAELLCSQHVVNSLFFSIKMKQYCLL